MLPEAELQQLAADIKQNGLTDPITKLDGLILDGRNRYAACKIAGINPVFEEYHGDDPLAFVFSKNFTRRQLNESQKAMIGGRYATLRNGANQYSEGGPDGLPSGKTNQEAANMVGVSPRTIKRARVVINDGTPGLQAAVESGDVSVNAAEQIARLPHDEQVEILEKPTRSEIVEAVKERLKNNRPQAPAHYPTHPTPLSESAKKAGEEAARESENLWLLKSTWKKTTKKDRAEFIAWTTTQNQ